MSLHYSRETGELEEIGDSEPDVFLERTEFGFDFGALHVEATTSIQGRAVVTLWTDEGIRIEVRCSPKGRFASIQNKGLPRVVMHDGS